MISMLFEQALKTLENFGGEAGFEGTQLKPTEIEAISVAIEALRLCSDMGLHPGDEVNKETAQR